MVAFKPTPLEVPIALDQDLTFAAHFMFRHREGLSAFRREAVQAVAGLQSRWTGVTERLRSYQAEETRKVIRGRDIGLIPLLAVLMRWPDFKFGMHLIEGFPAVGHCEWSGVWARRVVTPDERQDWREGADGHNRLLLSSMRPGQNDDVILEKSEADVKKSFAPPPWTTLHS